ncbi:MAG: hypothetical protein K2H64_08595 [Desulfovibrio sp.]|nr:hypothetical protein [Desulfovibrio sp.]
MIKILEPRPRLCPGQPPPKYPPTGNPFLKAIVGDLENMGARGVTIDGYIDDRDGNITRIIYKREFADDAGDFNPLDLYQSDVVRSVKTYYKTLARALGCGIDFVFIPGKRNQAYAFAAEPPFAETVYLKYISTFDDYAERIRFFRKRTFNVTKPLKVANSGMECYLANVRGKDPFPGDIDLAIYREDKLVNIAEFKTHNLPTPIVAESFDKYRKQDWRRLKVICDLCAALGMGGYYFVIWGERHPEIKIQKISIAGEIVSEEIIPKEPARAARILLEKVKERGVR